MSSVDKSLGTLAKSATVIFVGTLVGQVLALVGEMLIIRALPPGQYGLVAFAYTVVVSLGTLLLLGVNDGVTRMLSATNSANRREQILQSGYAIVLSGGLVAVCVGFAGRHLLARAVSMPALAELLVVFLPYLLLFPAAQLSFATLRAHKRSVRAALSRHVGPRILALGALVVALALGNPLAGAVGYWLLVPTVWLLVSMYFVGEWFTPSRLVARRPDLDVMRDLWSFSWPLAAGSVIFLLLRTLDIFMIGYFLDARQVGLYRSIQPLRQVTTFALASFTFVFLPMATEYYEAGDHAGLERIYAVSTKWILVVTFPPLLVFTLFAPDVIRVLFGREYVAAAPAMSVLVGGFVVRVVTGMNGDIVRAIDRPRIELHSALVGVVGNVVCNIVLIPRYGIVGAAVATVVGYGLYNVTETGLIYLEVGISPPIRENSKSLILPLLVGIALVYASPDDVGMLGLAGIGVVLVFTQLLSLLVTRSVGETDILLVGRIEHRLGVDLRAVKSILESRL